MRSAWAILMMLLLAVAPARLSASVPAEHSPSCCSGCHCCLEEAPDAPADDVPAPPARPLSIDPFAGLKPVQAVAVVIPVAEAQSLPDRSVRPLSDVPLFQRYCLLLI